MKDYKYTDEDITFYIQVYKEFVDVHVCLLKLRKVFKKSNIILLSDGDYDTRYKIFEKRFNVKFVMGRRLIGIENGGKMLERAFKIFLKNKTKYFIKIDPDTNVHRRFKYLLHGNIIFGTLEHETVTNKTKLDPPNVQGGFIGLPSKSIEKIIKSNILKSDKLLDYKKTYMKNIPELYILAERDKRISDDFMLRYICNELKINFVNFDEVFSSFFLIEEELEKDYAVTHPHKIRVVS